MRFYLCKLTYALRRISLLLSSPTSKCCALYFLMTPVEVLLAGISFKGLLFRGIGWGGGGEGLRGVVRFTRSSQIITCDVYEVFVVGLGHMELLRHELQL